ncbi:MAG: hypothetical protein AAF721_03795 [Myxococcota bacterium]
MTKQRNLGQMLLAVTTLSGGCQDTPPCSHRICDISDAVCGDFVAEVVGCQRDVGDVRPPVSFATKAEVLAGFDTRSEADLEWAREYYAGEALVGLMPANYDPANELADSLEGAVAFYDPEGQDIVIISDALPSDAGIGYGVLVHEMVHAYQDVEYDLEALSEEYATTFVRSLGLRAAVEGEATLYQVYAELELEGIPRSRVLWDSYFRDFQESVLTSAQETDVPSLAARGLFPYAFGSELMRDAWEDGGADAVRELVQSPPDSVRQVMAGYGNRPPQTFNEDAALAPAAVPVLAEHSYLGGGPQGAWLINAMLQRTAGSGALWSPAVDSVSADHLSVFKHDDTGERVAVWRVVGLPLQSLLEAGSVWTTSESGATTHWVEMLEGDLVMVATETADPRLLMDSITEWESSEEARARADLVVEPRPLGELQPSRVARRRRR